MKWTGIVGVLLGLFFLMVVWPVGVVLLVLGFIALAQDGKK